METIDFKSAFKYPFNRAKGLLNILWLLLPIIGWFILFGYGITIVKHFLKSDFSKLPVMDIKANLSLGFFMFLKSIPFVIVLFIIQAFAIFIPLIGTLVSWFISLFIVPILTINFFKKETVSSYFEFEKLKHVFNNFGDYIIVLLKTIALTIIFFLLIIILVGIPAGSFTKNIFFADFYRRNVKE
ncbi:DUF4013 domain-containing protein [Candidatus Woesearchaeota archaeon]|nr:DUF4013 domain-containing protein [Candidatus Woesearchaeota archaeon]